MVSAGRSAPAGGTHRLLEFAPDDRTLGGMKLGRTLADAGDSLLDRVLCVTGAVLFSQVPEFMQQYLQRLGGHLDEARRQLEQFRHVAAESGLTLERLIDQTQANADPAVARLSGVMSEAATRVHALELAQTAIASASVWTRPVVFLEHVDRQIARATWSIFQPAVPTTLEGFVYATLGMLVLLCLYHGCIRYPVVRRFRRREARPVIA